CDFVRVRSGAATVVTPEVATAVSGVASVCERNCAIALFVICAPTGSVAPTVTSKANEVLFPPCPAAVTSPPRAAVAPCPSRKTTLFDAESNSAWSSPEASLFVPGLHGRVYEQRPGRSEGLSGACRPADPGRPDE